jgi:tetratricopeptide (TPR) repeat protein
MKTSAEVIDHIISEKLTEKPKLEEPKEFVKENKTIIEDTKTVIEEPKKVVREPRVITNQHENKVEIEKFEIKRDNNISTKSITDDIFDKIANLKIDKSKTNIIDGKTNGVRKDDIFKTKREPIISKKSEPDINLNSESEIVIIKEDSKVDSAEIKEIKKRDIVTNLESINERIEKEEKLKKEEIILEEKTIIETKLDNSDEEKPLELPDKEEVEFIKKVIAEIKGEPKSEAKPKEEIKSEVIVDKIEVEKVIEKLEKVSEIKGEPKSEAKPKEEIKTEVIIDKIEVEKVIEKIENVSEIKEEIKISVSKEKPVDIIINNEKELAKIKEKEENDAADSVFNKIAEFKKRRTAGKQEKEELVEKFIQTEPRLDRTKEIDIKGDVSKESTKEKQPVVTELMANIFINQGHYDKAIDIFEKLILKNPEKKDYFASKIAETQKLRK